jgi:hypothetical protein
MLDGREMATVEWLEPSHKKSDLFLRHPFVAAFVEYLSRIRAGCARSVSF